MSDNESPIGGATIVDSNPSSGNSNSSPIGGATILGGDSPKSNKPGQAAPKDENPIGSATIATDDWKKQFLSKSKFSQGDAARGEGTDGDPAGAGNEAGDGQEGTDGAPMAVDAELDAQIAEIDNLTAMAGVPIDQLQAKLDAMEGLSDEERADIQGQIDRMSEMSPAELEAYKEQGAELNQIKELVGGMSEEEAEAAIEQLQDEEQEQLRNDGGVAAESAILGELFGDKAPKTAEEYEALKTSMSSAMKTQEILASGTPDEISAEIERITKEKAPHLLKSPHLMPARELQDTFNKLWTDKNDAIMKRHKGEIEKAGQMATKYRDAMIGRQFEDAMGSLSNRLGVNRMPEELQTAIVAVLNDGLMANYDPLSDTGLDTLVERAYAGAIAANPRLNAIVNFNKRAGAVRRVKQPQKTPVETRATARAMPMRGGTISKADFYKQFNFK